MLVLSRKMEESVIVDGFNGPERMLKVTVLGIRGDKVRLGFEVNKEIPVHRAELWERIRNKYKSDHAVGVSGAPGEVAIPNSSIQKTFRR
jgi:carbon storage regulator